MAPQTTTNGKAEALLIPTDKKRHHFSRRQVTWHGRRTARSFCGHLFSLSLLSLVPGTVLCMYGCGKIKGYTNKSSMNYPLLFSFAVKRRSATYDINHQPSTRTAPTLECWWKTCLVTNKKKQQQQQRSSSTAQQSKNKRKRGNKIIKKERKYCTSSRGQAKSYTSLYKQ